jgi:sugar lactone lactonase YvrE
MFRGLPTLPVWQRRIIFIAIFGGIIVFLIGCTLFLITQTLFVQRSAAVSLVPEVSVREYAALPDDNAYPPTVAAAADGTVYTGSYATGAIWQIATDGGVSEVANTSERIGSVSGITVAADGSLLVVDAGDSDPRTAGGALWRVTSAGDITALAGITDARGFVAPDDVAVDAAGNIYLSDRGRSEVWRFAADGSNGELWWVPPVDDRVEQRGISGLAYDAASDALLITDAEANDIYRVAVGGGATETLYQHGAREFAPGFDGITVAPDGTIYVAALGQNGIARVGEGELDYVAGLFRGASDVEYSGGRLYVANFDQSSLVIPIRPALPFAIDVIEFVSVTATPSS